MIYPNKHIRFEESIIYKMLFLLEASKEPEVSIRRLYEETKHQFDGIDEFIYSLDVLYVLDMITVNFETENVRYVKRT